MTEPGQDTSGHRADRDDDKRAVELELYQLAVEMADRNSSPRAVAANTSSPSTPLSPPSSAALPNFVGTPSRPIFAFV